MGTPHVAITTPSKEGMPADEPLATARGWQVNIGKIVINGHSLRIGTVTVGMGPGPEIPGFVVMVNERLSAKAVL